MIYKVLISLFGLLLVGTMESSAQLIDHTIPREWGTISATLDRATSNSDTAILIIAGSGPTDRNGNSGAGLTTNSYKMLSDELVDKGFNVMRYDKRAIGLSTIPMADIPNLTFDDYIEDARACVEYLRAEGFNRVFLAGHSEGGEIATILAASHPDIVDGAILLCAPAYPIDEILITQLSAQLLPANTELMAKAEKIINTLKLGAKIDIAEIPNELIGLFHPSVQPFLINSMEYNPAEYIARCEVPVLIISGGRDIQVSLDNGNRLKEAYPKAQHIIFENMSHVLKDASTTDRMTQYYEVYLNSSTRLTEGLTTTIAEFINNIK